MLLSALNALVPLALSVFAAALPIAAGLFLGSALFLEAAPFTELSLASIDFNLAQTIVLAKAVRVGGGGTHRPPPRSRSPTARTIQFIEQKSASPMVSYLPPIILGRDDLERTGASQKDYWCSM
ncbi:hypothetical protein PENSPDRAFT_759307 [Peniophora sp. CONT]|nr:hypothetical protein PENSPDRAFT_759307 [Peniophora sp. CONT]